MSYLYRCVILMLLGLSSLLPSAALALNLSQATEATGGKAPQPKPHHPLHPIDLAGPADENVQRPPTVGRAQVIGKLT